MARVRPGVALVRAIFSPASEFKTLDLPTFERPRKAISGTVGCGKCAASIAAVKNLACTFNKASRFSLLSRHPRRTPKTSYDSPRLRQSQRPLVIFVWQFDWTTV